MSVILDKLQFFLSKELLTKQECLKSSNGDINFRESVIIHKRKHLIAEATCTKNNPEPYRFFPHPILTWKLATNFLTIPSLSFTVTINGNSPKANILCIDLVEYNFCNYIYKLPITHSKLMLPFRGFSKS